MPAVFNLDSVWASMILSVVHAYRMECFDSTTLTWCFYLCFHLTVAELCALSEYRIYPGNGKLMIRRDGKPIWLGSSKAHSLTLQRKKAAKLVWTQAWRRLHKKGLSETTSKKRTRRANKVQRAVVGASLEDIKKRATEKSSVRTAARESALKELKAKKTVTKKSGAKGAKSKGAQFQKVPKHMPNRSRGGGSTLR
jgi:large subunit ribosomal protein L24e